MFRGPENDTRLNFKPLVTLYVYHTFRCVHLKTCKVTVCT